MPDPSIETRYRFEPERAFDGHFVMGKLQVVETSLNAPGAVTPIRAGAGGLVHALFHLERPSVSIVVRTFRDAHAGPQFNFARAGIGYDPFFVEAYRDRALQLVTMLRRTEHPAFERLVGDLIARSDLHMAYRVLGACAELSDAGLFARLLDRVSDRPAAAAVFEAAFREARRVGFLYSRRALVKDPELRFFLGVLLNATRREDALALVHARAPEAEPAAKTAAWVRRLSTVNAKLQPRDCRGNRTCSGSPSSTTSSKPSSRASSLEPPRAALPRGRRSLPSSPRSRRSPACSDVAG